MDSEFKDKYCSLKGVGSADWATAYKVLSDLDTVTYSRITTKLRATGTVQLHCICKKVYLMTMHRKIPPTAYCLIEIIPQNVAVILPRNKTRTIDSRERYLVSQKYLRIVPEPSVDVSADSFQRSVYPFQRSVDPYYIMSTFVIGKTRLHICLGDITHFGSYLKSKNIDEKYAAIVNAANTGGLGGGGVDKAITEAGGEQLSRKRLTDLQILQRGSDAGGFEYVEEAFNKFESLKIDAEKSLEEEIREFKEYSVSLEGKSRNDIRIRVGTAKVTSSTVGFSGLGGVSSVIHAVGMDYDLLEDTDFVSDGRIHEPVLGNQILKMAYAQSLLIADKSKTQYLALPYISGGDYRGGKNHKETHESLLTIALNTINGATYTHLTNIYFVLYEPAIAKIADKTARELLESQLVAPKRTPTRRTPASRSKKQKGNRDQSKPRPYKPLSELRVLGEHPREDNTQHWRKYFSTGKKEDITHRTKDHAGNYKDHICTLVVRGNNVNMLEVAAYEYYGSKAMKIGYLIAGNASKVGGDTNKHAFGVFTFDKSSKQPNPQEEGSFNNFFVATTSIWGGNAARTFNNRMGDAHQLWGVKDTRQGATSTETKQGIDYTETLVNPDDHQLTELAKRKYTQCILVGNNFWGYSQSGVGSQRLQPWNTELSFECSVFITVGPQGNIAKKHKYPDSGMARTYDQYAAGFHSALAADGSEGNSFNYVDACLRAAYTASLNKMDREGCVIAIVPGLSTGIYAPRSDEYKQGSVTEPIDHHFVSRMASNIETILENIIRTIKPRSLKRVIYCNPYSKNP